MSLISNELNVIQIKELLIHRLAIPPYQRPYRWSKEAANILFDDLVNAYINHPNTEYRLGSIILHKDNDVYNIVDGQQRITTLTLIICCLNKKKEWDVSRITALKYRPNSGKAIETNLELIRNRVLDFEKTTDGKTNDFLKFILTRCSLVKMVTTSQSEAFQFFDSQNARGKELYPHDLLKAYHLREMGSEREEVILDVIRTWETYSEKTLPELFSSHLYPLTQWYRRRYGIGYSTAKIAQFKGTKSNATYNYILYHKAANIFVENMNENAEEFNRQKVNQFQLTQPILSGTRFFKFVDNYVELKKSVCFLVDSYNSDLGIELPLNTNGDLYIKRLLLNSMMFFADRFGVESISDSVYKKLFSYAYSLRLQMQLVYKETVNNYALGVNRCNHIDGVNFFELINDMVSPNEIQLFLVKKPEQIFLGKNDKYKGIYDKVAQFNGWN